MDTRRHLHRAAAAGLIRLGIENILGPFSSRYYIPRKWRGRKKNVFQKEDSFQILIYHRIGIPESSGLVTIKSIPTTLFCEQMKKLSSKYNILSLGNIVSLIRSGRKIPENCLCITFDDGYLDFYENAFPILKKYNIPATMFLATECIDSGEPPWYDKIIGIVNGSGHMEIQIADTKYSVGRDGDRKSSLFMLLRRLRGMQIEERENIIKELYSSNSIQGKHIEYPKYLNWGLIKNMSGEGIDFGAHTVSHPNLAKVPISRADWEIRESKMRIENQLQKEVNLFAYPHGEANEFNEDVIRLLKANGFHAAVTTVFRTNRSGDDLFRLGRIQPWEEHLPSLRLKLLYYRLTEQVQ